MQNEFPPLAAAANATTAKLSRWERFSSRFHMRPPEDDEPQSWWIASTAIPLVAAAAGPLANVMSIVALVMPWRNTIISREKGPAGTWVQEGYSDPHCPPTPPNELYSQAYWSAVIAAILYFILGSLLMINMLGYFLGKYPQHFSLTDDQRTLILQMTGFVVWLLIGAAIFQRVLEVSFADALYFCDITVLTLGFGDITPHTAVGMGLIWPYAVIGIVMLGLVVGSIHQFAREVHYDNVVRKHIEHKRQTTFDRSVTFEQFRTANKPSEKDIVIPKSAGHRSRTHRNRHHRHNQHQHHRHGPILNTINALASSRRPRLLVMREEKDRFDAMRAIQYETMRFRRWNDLIISIIVYGIVWTGGAVVFWRLEDMSYFDSLYFCFCSLITIGYGDFTPQSNAGRPFFVMWSLIAIPTMTMLISQMSDTVVAGYKHSTEKFSDYFVMPRQGAYKGILGRIPLLRQWIQIHQEKQRLRRGFEVGAEADEAAETEDRASTASRSQERAPVVPLRPRPGDDHPLRTIEELARDENPSPFELAEQLAFAIRRTTHDAREGKRKRYTYEEWVEFTRLIQFTDPHSRPSSSSADRNKPFHSSTSVDEDEYGVLNWDWIGENSPMLAHQSEPEWILDRLCESLVRYVSTQEQARVIARGQIDDVIEEPTLRKERDLGIEES
ncbi:Outward-rectifier potassium channel TOK1 [Penicillium subrubescens]|uniref:Outward-rectifier potassium channel TOK1 n=1 Tax=Penicillium subrubescens TaxID=1316194 RepID=A0A1Q5UE55_9EURO|nr:Outward-rectifier potassium channel TOK1 [Penicillium subrubescens]